MGSMFSMEQTMTTLSLRSRMTSSSNSFQPMTLSSSRTWRVGEASRPALHHLVELGVGGRHSSPVTAQREAGTDDERETKSVVAGPARASATLLTTALSGTRSPMEAMVSRNSSRASARRMAA